MKKILKILALVFSLIIIFIVVVNFYVLSFSSSNYYKNLDNMEVKNVWLVFWASVKRNGPSDILKDRLDMVYKAYIKGKISKIIVSGDNRKVDYNEPLSMKKYLVKMWVKEYDIYPDYAWFDTYDSIYRAREIFDINEIVLFTQDFHLKRAMYISNRLWIQTYWVETNLHIYRQQNYNNIREIWARVKAFLDVEILKSKPKYLWEKIEIISNEKIENIKKEILNK